MMQEKMCQVAFWITSLQVKSKWSNFDSDRTIEISEKNFPALDTYFRKKTRSLIDTANWGSFVQLSRSNKWFKDSKLQRKTISFEWQDFTLSEGSETRLQQDLDQKTF